MTSQLSLTGRRTAATIVIAAPILAALALAAGAACAPARESGPSDAGRDSTATPDADGAGGDAASSSDGSGCLGSDVLQIGICQQQLGFTWTGVRCEPVSGCACGPQFCDSSACDCPPYQTNDECMDASVGCGACAPTSAAALADCSAPGQPKWAWNGSTCVAIPPGCCTGTACCQGTGCGVLWDYQSDCESYFEACPRPGD